MSSSVVTTAQPDKRREGGSVSRRTYTTAELAKMRGVLPESIRTSVWRDGHFMGVKPIKSGSAKSARLLWPVNLVDAAFERGAA